MRLSKIGKFAESELGTVNTWNDWTLFGEPEVEHAPQMPTVEQIEAMQKQAYDEAFAQGKQQGFEEGRQQGYEAGRAEGHQDGYKVGYEEAQSLMQQKASEWQELLAALEQPFKQLDQEVEQALVDLVIAVSRQVVRREIKLEPGQIVAVLREAINALPLSDQKITITLHPEDAELVRSALKVDDSLPSWRMVEDPLLTRGGCRVATEYSSVDATLENRLTAVITQMLGGERQQDDAA